MGFCLVIADAQELALLGISVKITVVGIPWSDWLTMSSSQYESLTVLAHI